MSGAASLKRDWQMNAHQIFIGGGWRGTSTTIPVINPSDGQVMAEIARGGAAEIDAAVAAGEAAMTGEWGRLDATARGRLLTKMSELIRRDADDLARLESEDVGKPMTLARGDVQACARYFEYYGGAAGQGARRHVPLPERVYSDDRIRAAWRRWRHHALELSPPDDRPFRCSGPRHG